MADAIYDALGGVLTRWTIGGGAALAVPVWKAELGDDPVEAELRLLALAGQFLGGMVVAEPAGAVYTPPDIPALALPSAPSPIRPLVRRILAREREAGRRRLLLDFLAARGRTMHPADWMPSAGDEDVPEIYAPWRDWAAAVAVRVAVTARADEGLTAENWGDYWPAAREAALIALRRRDPAAARAVLEAKIDSEGAEIRLRLLAVLVTKLSVADRPFLEKLADGDRAPKVKALAASLLARLGLAASGGDAVELAEFFEARSKGLLRRTKTLAAKTLKTPAQTQRRHALLSSVDATAFAAALQQGLDTLIGMWCWGENLQVDRAFAGMIARSGPDGTVAMLLDLLSDRGPETVQLLLPLAPRLDSHQRDETAQRMLRGGLSFQSALSIAGGTGRIDGALDFPAGAGLLEDLRQKDDDTKPAETAKLSAIGILLEQSQKKNDDVRPADQANELHALGLLASTAAARDAIARLNAIGVLSADPRLDMLRLNAALDDHGAIA
jgi:hypothetical protein